MSTHPSLTLGQIVLLIVLAGLIVQARRTREGKSPGWVRILVVSWLAIDVLLKAAFATALMSSELAPGPAAWLWSAVFLLFGAALTLMIPQRPGDLVCWLFAVVLSLLFWGDVLYYRQFQDFLMLNHFLNLWSPQHQGPAQAAALQVATLIEPIDHGFWLDLPFVFILLWLIPPAAAPPRKLRFLPAALLPVFILGNLLWLSQADPRTKHFYVDRLYNRSHVSKNGLVAYHLYDLCHWLQPRLSKHDSISDDLIRKRLEISAQTIGPDYPGFGCAEKANVIIVQLESFQYFLIGMEVEGQEVTPFLNELRTECLYGNALDQTASGSTSDSMFCMLNSLQPPSGGPFCFLFPTNHTRALPRILSERGWNTLHVMSYDGSFWNTRLMGEGFGFQEQVFTTDMRRAARGENVGWSLSDAALFERLRELLKNRAEPFFCYVTTTMMHHPFIELHPYQQSLTLPPELDNTMAGHYLQLARFRDQAIELFIHRLKEDGLWDKSIVVFCGDHRSRMPDPEFERLGIPEPEPVRGRIPLFVHLPKNVLRGELAEVPGHLDVAPTLLHLLGVQEAGQVFLGRNLLAGKHASSSQYGYISDGEVALSRGAEESEDRLVRLSDGEKLPLTDPRYLLLREQLDQEVRVSDTLLYGNRILEFSETQPGSRVGRLER